MFFKLVKASFVFSVLVLFFPTQARGDVHAEINDSGGQLNFLVTISAPHNEDFSNFGNPRDIFDPLTFTDTGNDTSAYDIFNWNNFGDWFNVNQAFLIDGFFDVQSSSTGFGVFLDDDNDSLTGFSDDFGVTVPSGTNISSGVSFTVSAPLPNSGFTAFFTPGSYSSGSNTLEIYSIPEPSSTWVAILAIASGLLRRESKRRT